MSNEPAVCLDCGAAILICDHAVARLLDPERSFHASEIEQLTAERDALKAALSRATLCLQAIEQETRYACSTTTCNCSGTAMTVEMARLMIRAWQDPESLGPGHHWLLERLTEGSDISKAYADAYGSSLPSDDQR